VLDWKTFPVISLFSEGDVMPRKKNSPGILNNKAFYPIIDAFEQQASVLSPREH
jgi:hypothetical protein